MIPVLNITVTTDRGYALVPCAAQGCSNALPISVEDAKVGSVPRVAGWRTAVIDGEVLAYCGECAHKNLPPETDILYRHLQGN